MMSILIAALLSANDSDYMDRFGCEIMRSAKATEYRDVATTIAAIGALESGWGSAAWVSETNQVWGAKERRERRAEEKPISLLRKFKSFGESVKFILGMFRRRGFPKDREGFVLRLQTSGYHATPGYSELLNSVEKRIIKNIRRCE